MMDGGVIVVFPPIKGGMRYFVFLMFYNYKNKHKHNVLTNRRRTVINYICVDSKLLIRICSLN